MQCQSIRPGVECFFWKKSGCSNKGGLCHEIAQECQGCTNIFKKDDKTYCAKFPEPALRWLGAEPCNFATHMKVEEVKKEEKKVNPLKASKRAARSK